MKTYRTAIATLVLAFALSVPAFAEEGIIWTGKTPPPPPPQPESIIHPDGTTPPSEEDTLTEIALTLLQTLLPLL